jgi:hypothetical protein
MLIILLGTVQTQIYISTVNLQSFKYIDFYIISEENVTKINISQRCFIKRFGNEQDKTYILLQI